MDQQKIHIEAHVYLTQEQYDYLVAEAKRMSDLATWHGLDHIFQPEHLISAMVSRAIDQKLTGH
jgi:hypothetical protein